MHARICSLLFRLFMLLLCAHALQSAAASPENADGRTHKYGVIEGTVSVVDRNWRFASARAAFGATELSGRRYLAGAFRKRIEGLNSNYQMLLMPENEDDVIELVVFRHDGRMYSTYNIPLSEENRLFRQHTPARTFFVKSETHRMFLEQLDSGELLVSYLDANPPKVLSILRSQLSAADELLGVIEDEPKRHALLVRDNEQHRLKFYRMQEPTSLSLLDDIPLTCPTKGGFHSGRFLRSETVDLLLQCSDGSMLLVEGNSRQARVLPASQLSFFSNAFVGDFNADGKEELLNVDLAGARMLFAQFDTDAVQLGERALPDAVAGSAGVLKTQFESPAFSELAFFDTEFHYWQIMRLTTSFELESLAKLSLEDPFPVTDLLRLRTEAGSSSIVLLGPEQQYAISTYGLRSPLPGARVALGFAQFTTSDGSGRFQFKNLEAGTYQVQVSAPGYNFEPQSQELLLTEGGARAVNFLVTAPEFKPRTAASICVGYNDLFHRWGYHSLGDDLFSRCAQDSVMIQMQDSRDLYDNSCCPLPASDILTQERSHTREACPEGYVATGPIEVGSGYNPTQFAIECTKVNVQRYQLGPEEAGRYWGIGESFRAEGSVQKFELLPEAVRYSVGRVSHRRWDNDGCIGPKPGMLLSTVSTKNCKFMRFRELQYRGLPGDPPQGTPVPMFPECAVVSSAFAPTPQCASRN